MWKGLLGGIGVVGQPALHRRISPPMNWKWLLGGLGVLGIYAFFREGTSRTVVVEHGPGGPEPEPELVRPGTQTATETWEETARRQNAQKEAGTGPYAPRTGGTGTRAAARTAPFIVEVVIHIPVVVSNSAAENQLREGAAAFARNITGKAARTCPSFPVPAGTAARSVVVADADANDNIKVTVTWPAVAWAGSTPEMTQCLLRMLRSEPRGSWIQSVVVR